MTGYIEGIIALIKTTLNNPAFIIQSNEIGLHGRIWVDLDRRGPHDYYSDISIAPEKLTISMDIPQEYPDDPNLRSVTEDITIPLADPTWTKQLQTLYANWITECRHE